MPDKTKVNSKVSSTIAKTDDGTIQITYIIPSVIILEEKKKALQEAANDLEIPGFRKGKAPIAKVEEHVPKETLIEHILGHILPGVFGETIKANNLKPAIYPRFEIICFKY